MQNTRIAICTGLLFVFLTSPATPLRAQTAPLAQPDAKPPKVTLASLAGQVTQLTQTVTQLSQTVQSLQNQLASANAQNAFALGQFVTVDTKNTINGLKGPHIIVTGANLHVRSGSGQTLDNTGLGNLVVGYNGDSVSYSFGKTNLDCDIQAKVDAARTGSHNLIVGDCHEFTSSGGVAEGFRNVLSGFADSVSGGAFNFASALFSSVSGGFENQATGLASSVSGGSKNQASGQGSSVSGGEENAASGDDSSVSGGTGNTASGPESSVSGGEMNTASGSNASIGGGQNQNAETNDQNIN